MKQFIISAIFLLLFSITSYAQNVSIYDLKEVEESVADMLETGNPANYIHESVYAAYYKVTNIIIVTSTNESVYLVGDYLVCKHDRMEIGDLFSLVENELGKYYITQLKVINTLPDKEKKQLTDIFGNIIQDNDIMVKFEEGKANSYLVYRLEEGYWFIKAYSINPGDR